MDCCSLVHAKAMRGLGHAPLELLHALALQGVRFVCTAAVLGELQASSLRETLDTWRSEGLLVEEAARMNERRQVLNHLRRGDMEPGRNDVGLVVVARRLGAALLTHDAAASVLARRCGVVVVDLVDVAAWAVRAGVTTIDEVSAAWGDLVGLPWPGPRDPWEGSVAASVAARPGLGAVLDALMEEQG